MEIDKIQYLKDFVRKYIASWSSIADDDIEFSRLGSLSNEVYLVKSLHDVKPNKLILRKFAASGVIDREAEAKIFDELAKCGLGPLSYGGDSEIRLEEYFDARQIENNEFNKPILRRKLAIVMSKFHKVDVKGLPEESMIERSFNNPDYYKDFIRKCDETIFSDDEKILIRVLRSAIDDDNVSFVKKILPRDDKVFSHNDLLSGNVLITNSGEDVIFIDYEYGSYNFRGFDIGNMFKESLIDYSHPDPPYFKFHNKLFPSDEELKEFICYYLAFGDMDEEQYRLNSKLFVEDKSLLDGYISLKYSQDEFESKVKKILDQAKVAIIVALYYYSIWGVMMSKTIQIDFDYLKYASTLFSYYKKYRKEYEETGTFRISDL